eukprot:s1675_g18.t1
MEETGGSERKGGRKERKSRARSRTPPSRADVTPGKVKEMLSWLAANSGDHLSASQMAQYVLLQAVTLNGAFGRLLENSLRPTWEQGVRQRDLMPLPLWPDVIAAMEEVINSQKYKDEPGDWRQRGATKTKAGRALRGQGLLLWHGLVVVSLNWLHSGGNINEGVGPPAGRANAQQESALCRLWDLVKVFVDEKPGRGGVPRTPAGGWEEELGKLRVSYTGEVIEKAQPLTYEQIWPGLPTPEHGGLVDILEVVDERLRDKLLRPDLLLREVTEKIPQPRVMCDDEEWPKVVKALYDRHIVVPVQTRPSVQGVPVLNGAFGVIKPGKMTESDLPVLRMIIDLRASNSIMEQLQGDVATLTGAASFQKLMLGPDEELLISGDDLTAAFYLFRLPPCWPQYLVLRKPVPRSLFEPGKTGETLVGLNVLPMGWSSAVAVMQNAHRQLALRTELKFGAGLVGKAEIRKDAVFPSLEESPAWTVYLDDTTFLEKIASGMAEQLQGMPPLEQTRMRRVYEWWGIPTNTGKALERARQAERLGAVIDGEKGLLRVSTKRTLDLMSLGAWLRGQANMPRTGLQIYAGKAVHVLQFRRCLFSVLQEVFQAIAQSPERVRATTGLYDEMLVMESLLPVVVTDLRAAIDPVVTASDASETGGGACYASRLSRLGEQELEELMDGDSSQGPPLSDDFRDVTQKIIVIDLFAGIGGLERSLELAKLKPWFSVAVESDADCRRCLRRRFPGMEFVTDIRRVDREQVRKWLRKIPDANGVLTGGGSPCQGLSKLSVDRQHLEDERSKLFYEAVRVMKLVQEEARNEGMWCIKFLENVVPDEKDIREMSVALDMRARLVDSKHLSRARRPRLFWFSVDLIAHEEVEVFEHEWYDEIVYGAATEPMASVLEEGCRWLPGERDTGIRFPTFTRAIPRGRPPKAPAGLASTSEEGRERWRAHQFRYPPYTYERDYMVETAEGHLRPLNANERETLMGYRKGHTLDMARKIPASEKEKQALEDQRCSALGNAFHATVVAALFDHMLWSFGVKPLVGHHEIVEAWGAEIKRLAAMPLAPATEEAADQASIEEDPGNLSDTTQVCSHRMEAMEIPRAPRSATVVAGISERDLNLSVQMVQAFVRRQEYRGSDVRLDVGTLFRPGVSASRKSQAAVLNHPTKQSRKAERKKVGPLALLVVQPKTKQRYEESYHQFCQFHQISTKTTIDEKQADEKAAEYVEFLWEDGAPKSAASYALASLQFFQPQTKNHLVWAWKLVKTWNQVELPTRATPFSPEVLLGLVGQAFKWKQYRFGWLLVLGFSGFLRTSELLHLQRKDVVFSDKPAAKEAILLLADTKGTKRNFLPLDKVVLQEKLAIQAVQNLCRGLKPGDTLSQQTVSQFRSLFKSLLEVLNLDKLGYMPYSLRRGGVTSAYRQGMSLDTLVTMGRWQHLPTARLYIDAGLQSLASLSLPSQTLAKCAALRHYFRTVSQDGTRGRMLEIPSAAPKEMQQLIRGCWTSDYKVRPLMSEVLKQLRSLKEGARRPKTATGARPGRFD